MPILIVRRVRALPVATVVAATFGAVFLPGPASADGGIGDVTCPTTGSAPPGCDVNAGSEGQKGHGGGQPVSDGKCRTPQGQEIPCERDGAWAGGDGCYYKPTDPSPETVAALGSQPAGEGGWYLKACYSDGPGGEQVIGAPVWVAGTAPVMSPEVLARQARSRLELPEVVVRLNPSGDQLVNLPTWLALDASSWRTRSATAAVPGVSVTATARPVRATWAMGEGGSVVCTGPGTPWRPGTDPAMASPDCGFVYRHSSASVPGGRYTVTVTVAWEVTWAGAGRAGTVPGLTTTGTLPVRVQESQAVITH